MLTCCATAGHSDQSPAIRSFAVNQLWLTFNLICILYQRCWWSCLSFSNHESVNGRVNRIRAYASATVTTIFPLGWPVSR